MEFLTKNKTPPRSGERRCHVRMKSRSHDRLNAHVGRRVTVVRIEELTREGKRSVSEAEMCGAREGAPIPAGRTCFRPWIDVDCKGRRTSAWDLSSHNKLRSPRNELKAGLRQTGNQFQTLLYSLLNKKSSRFLIFYHKFLKGTFVILCFVPLCETT